jgi:hypothetical protein
MLHILTYEFEKLILIINGVILNIVDISIIKINKFRNQLVQEIFIYIDYWYYSET